MQTKTLFYTFVSFLFCCLFAYSLSAQEKINQTDAQGRKQGKWKKINELGYKTYDGEFKDNYEIGDFTYYYPNGKVKMILSYSEKGVRAKCKVFNEEEKLISEGEYENKKKNGIWLFYTAYGEKIAQESYKQGLNDGEWILYKDNIVTEKTTWKSGKKSGAWYQIFDIGYLNANYKDGFLSGLYEEHYTNKILKTKGNYLNGEKTGDWTLYDMRGNLTITETYQRDVLITAKINLTLTSGEAISQPINETAYFYLQNKNTTTLITEKGNKLTCSGDITEWLTEYLNAFGFRLINLKNKFYAKRSAIVRCQEDPETEMLQVILKPETGIKVYTDEEGQKSMDVLFKNE